jgi:ketosteroid isomerase-like protein
MSQQNVEKVRRFLAAFGNRQAEDLTDDALKQFFDSEVEWIPIPQGVLAGNRYLGFEGIRRFWADFIAARDELSVEPQEFREAHDLVVAVLRMRGRMHELDIDEVWSGLFKLRNGRIVRVQGFASRDGALEKPPGFRSRRCRRGMWRSCGPSTTRSPPRLGCGVSRPSPGRRIDNPPGINSGTYRGGVECQGYWEELLAPFFLSARER